jgi:hypothetical protein
MIALTWTETAVQICELTVTSLIQFRFWMPSSVHNVIEIGPTFYGTSLSGSKRIEFAE